MIPVAALGAKATLQLLGENVVVFALVCPTPEAANRVFARIQRRLDRRPAAEAVRGQVEPADPFAPGKPVRWSVFDWNRGEAAIDATVVRRLSDSHVEIRTRMGRLQKAHLRDLERGQRAS